jgi:mono/diheme cytochrome c family protein
MALLAVAVTIAAQDGISSVSDGVFTDEQATRGGVAYEQECATCHRADMQGDGIAPALTGATFDMRWNGLSVGDLFVSLSTKMPLGAPASLDRRTYVDVVSYVLKRNQFPAGSHELPTDAGALNRIIIRRGTSPR